MDFLKWVKAHEAELVQDTQEILKIKSVKDETTSSNNMPFGKGINDALEKMLDIAKRDGFKTENIDGYAGHIEYGEGEEIVGVLCHLDVVPEGDNWAFPPYGSEIKDGKIYARGALDDKGPTMAAYYGLKLLKDLNIKLNKRIRIILGTDEESGWGGIEYYFKHQPMPVVGFAPDANFPLIYGEKGILTINVTGDFTCNEIVNFQAGERYNVVPSSAMMETISDFRPQFEAYLKENKMEGHTFNENGRYQYYLKGKGAHAMEPEKGINAGTYLANFASKYITNPLINFIDKVLHDDTRLNKIGANFTDDQMGDLTCNVGIIKYFNSQGLTGLNLRCPINFNKDEFYQKLANALAPYNLSYEVVSDSKPHFVDPSDPLVTSLYDIYVKYTGDEKNKPMTIGGGTYARALKKGVAFGMLMPGRPDVVHQADEHVFIEDLILATAIYAEAMMVLGR